jgi:hypothetical protein
MSRVCKMEQRSQRAVRKMLEVEGEEIVVLRLYEKRKIKMISQIKLVIIFVVCKSFM